MRKSKYIIILLLVFWFGCQKKDIDCDEFCGNSFDNHSIEQKFKAFRHCKDVCPSDSISIGITWATNIGQTKGSENFLLEKLRTETDEVAVEDIVLLLAWTRQNILGRTDINDAVKQVTKNASEKDERDFIDKMLGKSSESRKERLEKLAKQIKEKTGEK